MTNVRRSVAAFVHGPVALLVLAADVLFIALAIAGSGRPWMWLSFASLLLAGFSAWRFHEIHGQLSGEHIDLSIEVGSLLLAEAKQVTKSEDAFGWVFLVSGVRITNRARDGRVTLGAKLRIDVESTTTYINEPEGRTFKPDIEGGPQWLRTPIRVGSVDTETGVLGFWLHPVLAPIPLGDDPLANFANLKETRQLRASLEFEDYVSGKVLKVTVPGSSP